jgi:hypothetical protein
MAFTEATKYEVKKIAHLSCCVCKSIGIEIHHIVPKSEGGSDEIDNAAPLCPSCHETYGANSQKRKFIKESRDIWYDICSKRYLGDIDRIDQLRDDIKILSNQLAATDLSKNIAEHLLNKLKESQFFASNYDEISWSIGDIIRFLLNYKEPIDPEQNANIDVCYSFLYNIRGGNDELNKEYDVLKNNFLTAFGNIIARKLTINLIQHSQINWFTRVSEDSLQKLMSANFLAMLLLLHHKDLNPQEFSLNVIFNKNEDLEAWLVEI